MREKLDDDDVYKELVYLYIRKYAESLQSIVLKPYQNSA